MLGIDKDHSPNSACLDVTVFYILYLSFLTKIGSSVFFIGYAGLSEFIASPSGPFLNGGIWPN